MQGPFFIQDFQAAFRARLAFRCRPRAAHQEIHVSFILRLRPSPHPPSLSFSPVIIFRMKSSPNVQVALTGTPAVFCSHSPPPPIKFSAGLFHGNRTYGALVR